MTGHCGVGDQGNKAENESAAEWAGEEDDTAGSEWLTGSMDVLAGLWVLGLTFLNLICGKLG